MPFEKKDSKSHIKEQFYNTLTSLNPLIWGENKNNKCKKIIPLCEKLTHLNNYNFENL